MVGSILHIIPYLCTNKIKEMANITQALFITGAIILLFYVATLLLIFSDLWAGVRKAKQRNEMRTSEAYKRTIEKINKYFNMMLALTVVDAIQIALVCFMWYMYGYDIPMLPVFSFLGTGYVAFVEVTSIMEPSDVKEKKQQDDFKRLVVKMIRDDRDFRAAIADIIEGSKQ